LLDNVIYYTLTTSVRPLPGVAKHVTSFKLLRAVRSDTGFHTTWLMVSELTGLKSCRLFFLEYHAREGVPDTHSEYRWVETSASSGVGGAGPQLQLSDSGDAVSMRETRVLKLRGDILTNHSVEFTCSPLGYLLNSWPM